MTIKLDYSEAERILITENNQYMSVEADPIMQEWEDRVMKLTGLCPYRKSSTFIAALGTAILAKTVDPRVDVYCLLDRDGGEFSYSARTLVDRVWAKNRAALGIDLGSNGANPLNNTPFFGKARIDEIKNVTNKEGFNYLKECLDFLAEYTSTDDAKSALRGFISVRKKDYSSRFICGKNAGDYLVISTLLDAIHSLTSQYNEDGRSAQAVASALLALAYGYNAVDVGHINDPDRNFPLDILVTYKTADCTLKIAVEVKDKPVGLSEILVGVEKAVNFDITDVIYLAVSEKQKRDDYLIGYERARDLNCKLVVYNDWESFVKACVSFSQCSGVDNFRILFALTGQYLERLKVSQLGIDHWLSFSSK
ncbi:restriction endonuclease, SacI family [Aeromonas veronii]|uniref:restriction endonuclease, SacI family n=1 Tax=Aeromonas veronii TaxID=654 RepID=UPI003159836D